MQEKIKIIIEKMPLLDLFGFVPADVFYAMCVFLILFFYLKKTKKNVLTLHSSLEFFMMYTCITIAVGSVFDFVSYVYTMKRLPTSIEDINTIAHVLFIIRYYTNNPRPDDHLRKNQPAKKWNDKMDETFKDTSRIFKNLRDDIKKNKR
jgi:hypothetical protein